MQRASPNQLAALQTAHAAATGLAVGALSSQPSAPMHGAPSQRTHSQAIHHTPASEGATGREVCSASGTDDSDDGMVPASAPHEHPDGHTSMHARVGAALGSPVSLKGAVSRPGSVRAESTREGSAAPGGGAESGGGAPSVADVPCGPSEAAPMMLLHDQREDDAIPEVVHHATTTSRRGTSPQSLDTPEHDTQATGADQHSEPLGRHSEVSEHAWERAPARPRGLAREDSQQGSEEFSMDTGEVGAGVSTPSLAPAGMHVAPQDEPDMAAILQDLGEAIESVAIDTTAAAPMSFSPYGPSAAGPYMHATTHTSPLQPYPPDALAGPHAALQPHGGFHVHSSASRSPSASYAGASESESAQATGSMANKYLARLKLPTAQPSIAGRSWLQGSTHVSPVPVAGEGAASGPSGFDPVAGLLGFSVGPRSGRDGVALHDAPTDSQAGRLGASRGSAMPHQQGFHSGVCSPNHSRPLSKPSLFALHAKDLETLMLALPCAMYPYGRPQPCCCGHDMHVCVARSLRFCACIVRVVF